MAIATVKQTGSRAYSIPPLENGDRLTRDEFERRYKAMPHLKKAELIEGVVYMPSPVYRAHGWAHGQVISWLGVYCASTPNVRLYDNTSVRLDMDNEVQPDALLKIETESAQEILQKEDDDYIEGAPLLVVEVAASSASYDLHDKLKVYRRNEVREYVIWQLYENELHWFQLHEGKYIPLPPDDEVIHSRIFPGLDLHIEALLAGKLAEVLEVLQKGMQSKKHEEFVHYLNNDKDFSITI